MNREQFVTKLEGTKSDNEVDELIDHAISNPCGSDFILDIAVWALLECRNGKHQPSRAVDIGSRWLGEFPRELSYVTALAVLHQSYSQLDRETGLVLQAISILNRGVVAGDVHSYFPLANLYWLIGDRERYIHTLRNGCISGSYDCCLELLLGDIPLSNEERLFANAVAATLPNLAADVNPMSLQPSSLSHFRNEFDHESGRFFVEYSPGKIPKALCLHARRHARPLLKRSMVSSEDGKDLVSSTRTSHGCFIPLRRMTISTIALDLMLAKESRLPVSHGEQLHAIAYERGDCFRPHRDSVYRDAGSEDVGHRDITVLLGASGAYVGGATSFPKTDCSVTLQCGDLLVFSNLTADGLPHDLSLHAGEPVESGEKWVFTKWMHTKPFN